MNSVAHADCRDFLPGLASNSIDAVVTDPPYEIGFMGKKWDATGIANDARMWSQVLRVLKPGGHLLAFAATRTYHRMVCAIEDGGFEIRDQVGWLYGSGFPKSLDVSKAIDAKLGAAREVIGKAPDRWTGKGTTLNFATDRPQSEISVTGSPVTAEAKRWDGWGTALKPAWEPICLARKPLIGTVAENVLEHGCGAINVDGCRIEGESTERPEGKLTSKGFKGGGYGQSVNRPPTGGTTGSDSGRWPANVIHDGSAEVIAMFPEQTSGANPTRRSADKFRDAYGEFKGQEQCVASRGLDSGSAARFFYSAKASGDEREGNTHATVKPLALMRYLVRLITPPGGIVLDHFCGSGTTLIAAKQEGLRFIGCDNVAEHVAITEARLARELL